MRSSSAEFFGLYAGRVTETSDPLRLGRVKVRVPILHGVQGGESGLIDDADLPWALASGLPAGGTQESGGVSWIPVVGDQVWIRFLDGELDKPVWEWGTQSVPQTKNFGEFPIHAYDKNGLALRRAAHTRFNHWSEILPTGHDIWTRSGYHFEIVDEQTPGTPSGRLTWSSALGFSHSLDDSIETLATFVTNIERLCTNETASAMEMMEYTAPVIGINFGTIELGGNYDSFHIQATSKTSRGLRLSLNQVGIESTYALWACGGFGVTNGAVLFDGDNNPYTYDEVGFGVVGDTTTIGYRASDPVVRLSDLTRALAQVKLIFDAHCHLNSGGQGIGGTPSAPALYIATGSNKVFIEPATRAASIVGISAASSPAAITAALEQLYANPINGLSQNVLNLKTDLTATLTSAISAKASAAIAQMSSLSSAATSAPQSVSNLKSTLSKVF